MIGAFAEAKKAIETAVNLFNSLETEAERFCRCEIGDLITILQSAL